MTGSGLNHHHADGEQGFVNLSHFRSRFRIHFRLRFRMRFRFGFEFLRRSGPQIVEHLREEDVGAGSASGFAGRAGEVVECGCESGREIGRKGRGRILGTGKVAQGATDPGTGVTSGFFRNDVKVTPPEELLQDGHSIGNQVPVVGTGSGSHLPRFRVQLILVAGIGIAGRGATGSGADGRMAADAVGHVIVGAGSPHFRCHLARSCAMERKWAFRIQVLLLDAFQQRQEVDELLDRQSADLGFRFPVDARRRSATAGSGETRRRASGAGSIPVQFRHFRDESIVVQIIRKRVAGTGSHSVGPVSSGQEFRRGWMDAGSVTSG